MSEGFSDPQLMFPMCEEAMILMRTRSMYPFLTQGRLRQVRRSPNLLVSVCEIAIQALPAIAAFEEDAKRSLVELGAENRAAGCRRFARLRLHSHVLRPT